MNEHDDDRIRLADLPVLSTRRACLLADCSRSTLQRSGIEPVGRRGRTLFYKTEDVLAWLRRGLESTTTTQRAPLRRRTEPRSSAESSDLDRLANLARHGAGASR